MNYYIDSSGIIYKVSPGETVPEKSLRIKESEYDYYKWQKQGADEKIFYLGIQKMLDYIADIQHVSFEKIINKK